MPIGGTAGKGFLQYIISIVFKRTQDGVHREFRDAHDITANESHHWALECLETTDEEGQGRDTVVFFPSRDGMQAL